MLNEYDSNNERYPRIIWIDWLINIEFELRLVFFLHLNVVNRQIDELNKKLFRGTPRKT